MFKSPLSPNKNRDFFDKLKGPQEFDLLRAFGIHGIEMSEGLSIIRERSRRHDWPNRLS